MDFSELITKRYSVRSYKSDPVEDDKLHKVLEAARIAPTAANRQPLRFIVIHTKGREDELKRIYKAPWFTQPPIVICACAIKSQAWVRSWDDKNHADIDVTIATDHLILEAANQGFGTCWIGAFDPTAAREVLGIPEDVDPVFFTPLGYPADQPTEKKRKPLDELVRYERWEAARDS